MRAGTLWRVLAVGIWIAAASAATVAGGPSVARAESLRSPPLRIDFISVGQGDAARITSPTGKTVLVDGGPREAAGELVAFLRGHGVGPIDLVVLTHRHADHLGGLAAVVRAVGVKMFMDAPFPHPSSAYTALLAALEAAAVPVRSAERGRTVELGGGATITLTLPRAADRQVAVGRQREQREATAGLAQACCSRPMPGRRRTGCWGTGRGSPPTCGATGAGVNPRGSCGRCKRRGAACGGGRNDCSHPAPRTVEALARVPAGSTDRPRWHHHLEERRRPDQCADGGGKPGDTGGA
jgi:hypothetical protein